jgi:myo-inositol-1(or 4)-monophosphatase
MFTSDLEKLKLLVKIAAKEELLSEFGHSTYEYKDDGSVVTPADLAMQDRMQKELKQIWPQYEMLGEEMTEAEQRQVIENDETNKSEGYWCIDPLDGTTNFAAGLPFFAVSIALIINKQQQLGLIYDPVRDEMFTAIKGQGAWLNDKPLPSSVEMLKRDMTAGTVASKKHLVAEIDIKRLPENLAVKLVTENAYISQRNIGSSAIDWCWMAAGRFSLYLHGGQKLWDYAAGSLIFDEVGGYSSSFDGQPVFSGELMVRSALASLDKDTYQYWRNWVDEG